MYSQLSLDLSTLSGGDCSHLPDYYWWSIFTGLTYFLLLHHHPWSLHQPSDVCCSFVSSHVTGGWWGSARNQLWIYLAWFSLWSRWNLKFDIDLFWLVNRHNKIILNYHASTITVHLRMLVHSSVFITEYTSVGWELISFCKFRSGHYNLCILSVFLPKLSIVKTRKKWLKERVQTQTAIEKNTMWGGHNNINDALRAIHKINGYWLFVSLPSVIRLWQQPVTFVEQIRLQIRVKS